MRELDPFEDGSRRRRGRETRSPAGVAGPPSNTDRRIYCNDAFAGVLAVAFENPLIAAAAFVGTWFGGFLFAGLMVKMRDIVWPLKTFHYVFPLGFSIHGLVFSDFIDSHYDRCDKYNSNTICAAAERESDVTRRRGRRRGWFEGVGRSAAAADVDGSRGWVAAPPRVPRG